jgi:hypothetical protein
MHNAERTETKRMRHRNVNHAWHFKGKEKAKPKVEGQGGGAFTNQAHHAVRNTET